MTASMTASMPHAAVPASPASAATRQLRPIVFVDGRCAPALTVEQYDAAGPLGLRRASLRGPRPTGDPRITVALPVTLQDSAVHWQVLVDGRPATTNRVRKSAVDSAGFEVVDDWARALERTLSAEEQRELMALTTLGQVLDWLADAAIAAGDNPVVAHVGDAARAESVTLGRADVATAGSVWSAMTERLNARVQTTLSRVAGQVRRVTRWVPAEHGRPVALPWARGGVGRVTATRSASPNKRARQWVARGARPRLEDTFPLTPAWDASLQAQPDDDYDAALSSDFSRFGRVFRAWVLNEDAAYAGSVYDTAAAFELDHPDRSALQLTDCLASDATGRPLLPVIEYSTDGGASWARYTGAVALMADRAGLVLDQPALPAGVVDAGQSGLLRLRVTAALVGPAPITTARWAGNPFLGTAEPVAFDMADAYGWRRIAPGSLHAAAIESGNLTADVRDDRPALLQALLHRMTATDRSGGQGTSGGGGRGVTVDLIGAWPGVAVGDRVIDPLGPGLGRDEAPVVLGGEPGVVDAVRVRFGTPDQGPGTRVWLGS